MPDFLLELISEEIPARMQAKASADLARLFAEQLTAAGLAATAIETHATPCRLALIARGLPAETLAVSEEIKGPRANAPPQALEGFLRKTGLSAGQLAERDGIYFALIEKPGRATASVLAEAIPAIVRAFPWPKSMRWGAASLSTESPRWVRPLQGIVALLGEEIVEFEIAGIRSGAATVGHRFHHPGIITIGGAHDYAEKLRACHVILDAEERRRIIAEGARAAASAAGLTLVEDEALTAENAGLTEWPVPLLGSFDPAFLEVPDEVIQLTMRTNQKYFACTTQAGFLVSNFVCTANIEALDGGRAIVAGNERVLTARLSDARFFWGQDLGVHFEDQAKKLSRIVFHDKLGTLAEKAKRVTKLARWLVEQRIVGRDPTEFGLPDPAPMDPALRRETEELANQAEVAARLCKADLVSATVGEFPELQGIIGGYLARDQLYGDAVADAIRDHYKPVGQGDDVPTAPVTVAVSLADKLDTIVSFFTIGEMPSGSRDPFALRRAALGAIRLIADNDLRLSVREFALTAQMPLIMRDLSRRRTPARRKAIANAISLLGPPEAEVSLGVLARLSEIELEVARNARKAIWDAIPAFFADRLKVQQREAGVRHDLIDAVFALGGEDDLVRLLARVKALQAFVETPEGADLLAGYKRAANILKKEGHAPSPFRGEGRLAEGERGEGTSGEVQALTLPPGATGRVPPSPPRVEGKKHLSYSPENEEASLIAALDSAGPRAAAAVEAEDFEGAMAALAGLRAPVDAFFEKVIVNDPDPAKREARLALLARMRDAVHQVADFSKIEG